MNGYGSNGPNGYGESQSSYPFRTPSRSPVRSRSRSPQSMLNCRHPTSLSQRYRDIVNLDRNYTAADFQDVVTTYGRYATLELVQGSVFYTHTEIPTTVIARNSVPGHANTFTRAVHATHPIPRRLLRELERESLQDLSDGLDEERWEVARSEEFSERLTETLARIDDVLEPTYGGGRAPANRREPSEAVERGNESRSKERN